MDLANPRLGDAQDGANLLEVQVLDVIQRQHLLHLLGQLLDAVHQAPRHLAARRLLEGISGLQVAGALQQVGAGVVDADHRRAGELLLARVEFLDADAQAAGDLFLVGRAAQLGLQAAGGVAQLVRQAAHVTRQRVARAQVVQHRAADAELGEGLEAIDALGVKALGGLHQADDARRDQVVDLDMRRQTARQATGDLLDVGKELRGVLVAARDQFFLTRLPRLVRLLTLLDSHAPDLEHLACHVPGGAGAAENRPLRFRVTVKPSSRWRSCDPAAVNRMTVALGYFPSEIDAVSERRMCVGCVSCAPSGDVPATEFLDQRGAVHAQQLGGAVLVAAGALQGLADQLLFQLQQQLAQVDAARR